MTSAAITTSVVSGGVNNHATVAEEANAYATDWVSQGIVGTLGNTSGVAPATGGFAVNQNTGSDMAVAITAGVGYVSGTPSGQGAQVLRSRMTSTYTAYTISANASGSTKYDWIYLQLDATKANAPASDASDVITLVTSRSSSNTTDNGTPPTYGINLAVVTVANGATAITNANIADKRTQSSLSVAASTASTGWAALSTSITAVTYNGSRSYSLTSSADVTGTVSAGMRFRTNRTVAAPTQSTSLNGTTQYYNRLTGVVNGMTFTNNFVVSAWVKLSSYANATIASRYNGTSGWRLMINANGQVQMTGLNASSANYSEVLSYQSIPLNKWVHVTAQLDMATFTATTTTSYVMIDGVDVPAFVQRGGTNPTSLLQAGNLEIGSWNGGLFPFPGKIAQVAIYNAKVTEANIRATISQGLAGTETSLISAYSFNNSITDLNTTNANNLTPNGSAVATNADSPFGGQAGGTISSTLDYAIVQTASASTLVVQVPEGCTIDTKNGISAVSYSSVKAPFGFPGQKGKWVIYSQHRTQVTQSSAASSTWYNVASQQLLIPIGEWVAGYSTSPIVGATTTSILYQSLSNANNTSGDTEFVTQGYFGASSTSGQPRYVRRPLSVTTATTYYLNSAQLNGTSVTIYNLDSTLVAPPSMIEIENAYL